MKKTIESERNKTIKQVATHFEVTILTVQNWKKNGCPYSVKRMPNENGNRNTIRFSFNEIRIWYKKYLNSIKWGRPKTKKRIES